MNFTKNDLREAFKKGEEYAYIPIWEYCFNRWYNQTFIDKTRCNDCVFGSEKNNKNCKECDEFSKFKQI